MERILYSSKQQTKRCAIYTRTSVENPKQSFSSVNAQFSACADYIGSQVGQGWQLVDIFYEDRGYSGGHTRRPAFQLLIADIHRGLIDIVVVHRLDRLSRSMTDFQRMHTLFQEKNVAIVSVTQSIDTSHYTGRLATNLLTTFAQFERDLIGERVKEKRAQTLRKGLWQGTSSPLGYKVENARLIVVPDEEKLVQEIFKRYAQGESVTELFKDLNARGIKTKQWQSRAGKPKGGKSYDRNAIYTILKNRVYLGEVFYADSWKQGQHAGIIDSALWMSVVSLLTSRTRKRKGSVSELSSQSIFPLKGRLFGADGRAMSPWLSSSYKNRKYAYYIPQRDIAEGAGASGLPRLQAANVNEQIYLFIKQCLNNPQVLIDKLPQQLTDSAEFDRPMIERTLKSLAAVFDQLFPVNQYHILTKLIHRVTVHADKLDVQINIEGLLELVFELLSDQPEVVAVYRQLTAVGQRSGR